MTCHYLNADFDLALRARPRRLEENAVLTRQIRELSAQALIGATSGDAALLRTGISQEFLDHLGACELAVPRVLIHPELDPRMQLRPFGWSPESIELNLRHDQPVDHPAPDTVRRVNSRSFTLELEADLFVEEPSARAVGSRAELEQFLARAAASSEWVVKAEHGNAGLGNRRVRSPRLTTADRRFVDGIFSEDDRLVIEPWRLRDRDWCVVFEVPFASAGLRIHETICTRGGAFIGALFEPGGPENMAWSDELAGAARRIASKLEQEGYLGPACFDAFSWRDGDSARLRVLVDLNCRRSMSDGAYRLWRQLCPERALFYRFFNRRKLTLPADLPQALAALGEQRYDPERRHGVLLASPLGFTKLAVILVAKDRSEIFALERAFRARFEE